MPPLPSTPAAFTSPSSPPNRSTAALTQRVHVASSRTSPSTTCAWPPAASICFATSPSRSCLRPATTTRAPAWPSASAHARPMPLEAPETSTTRFVKRGELMDASFEVRPCGCGGAANRVAMLADAIRIPKHRAVEIRETRAAAERETFDQLAAQQLDDTLHSRSAVAGESPEIG